MGPDSSQPYLPVRWIKRKYPENAKYIQETAQEKRNSKA